MRTEVVSLLNLRKAVDVLPRNHKNCSTKERTKIMM
jgi:hypothetical protein